MSGPWKAVSLLIFSCALAYGAQPPDYHLTLDPAHHIYARSAFLHGHRHGYEEGFHAADQDVHLGRNPRILDKHFTVPKTVGYRNEFGDKKIFRQGYESGYLAGYSDSFAGREFNHPPNLFADTGTGTGTTANLSETVPASTNPSADFDAGAVQGYRAASGGTSNFELRPGVAQYAQDFCRHNLVGGSSNQFCAGYSNGYLLGRSDLAHKLGHEGDTDVRIAANQP